MTEVEEIALYSKSFALFSEGRLSDLLPEYDALISNVEYLLAEWHKRSPEGHFWLELMEPLAAKIAFVSSSLENILHGTVHGRHTANVYIMHDLPSIYTLGRAQLEAYLTFFYLYVQPQTEDESKLRYWLYVVHSLTVRQTADITMLAPEMQQRYQEEKQRIDLYKDYIRNNSVYQSYTPSNQGRLITGTTAKETGWAKLIDAANLKTIGVKTYDLYANHAHSEYMSLIQLQAYLTAPPNSMEAAVGSRLLDTAAKTSMMLLALFTRQLSVLTGTTDLYNQLPLQLKANIKAWAGILVGETLEFDL